MGADSTVRGGRSAHCSGGFDAVVPRSSEPLPYRRLGQPTYVLVDVLEAISRNPLPCWGRRLPGMVMLRFARNCSACAACHARFTSTPETKESGRHALSHHTCVYLYPYQRRSESAVRLSFKTCKDLIGSTLLGNIGLRPAHPSPDVVAIAESSYTARRT